MSVAAKVMGKVLIRRISGGVDAKLRKGASWFQERKEYDRADIRSQEHRRASSGMEFQLICMFCRLRKGFRQRSQENLVEDHGELWDSVEVCQNGQRNV